MNEYPNNVNLLSLEKVIDFWSDLSLFHWMRLDTVQIWGVLCTHLSCQEHKWSETTGEEVPVIIIILSYS